MATTQVHNPVAVTAGTVRSVEGGLFNGSVAVVTGGGSPPTATIDWGDGTAVDDATLVPNPAGGHFVMGTHTYADEGGYQVRVTATDGETRASTITSGTVADAALSATGSSVATIEGSTFAGPVASFTDANPIAALTDFSATINWGDGTAPTAGTIASGGTGFSVIGAHSYAEEGSFSISATITDDGGSSAPANSSAAVADAALAAAEPSGGSNVSFVIRTYHDLLGRAPDAAALASFTSQLDSGTLTRDQLAALITASAEYRSDLVTGMYLRYLGRGPDAASLAGWVAVLGSGATDEVVLESLLGSAEYFQRAGGSNDAFVRQLFTDLLARPVDPGVLSFFSSALGTATMTRQQVAQAVATSSEYRSDLVGGMFRRFLHRTADSAELAAQVNLLSLGAHDEVVISALLGSLEYYLLTDSNPVVGVTEARVVARFADANPQPDMTDFSALVDHGDGSVASAAIVLHGPGGSFLVMDSHTYLLAGDFLLTTTIHDAGGSLTGHSSSIQVVNPMTASGVNVAATEGASFTGTVARFNVSDPNAMAVDFGATINWGDGTAPSGSPIAANSTGGFVVTGTHVYAEEGTFTPTVAITDGGFNSTITSGTASVADAALTAGDPTGGSNVAFVIRAFQDLLGRQADAATLANFAHLLDTGSINRSQLAGLILASGIGSR